MEDSLRQEPTVVVGGSRQRRLYRSIADRRIAGVCGGVAAHFGLDSFLVRVLWVVSCFAGFIGVLAYVAAWIIVPDNPNPETEPKVVTSNPINRQYLLGIILLILGILLLADKFDFDFLVPWHWSNYIPYWLNWGVILSIIIIGFGFALITRSPRLPSMVAGPTATATPTDQPEEPAIDMGKRLTRSLDDRMIGGVCGGIAKYFKIDPSLVRVGWVLLTVSAGLVFLGIVAYIVMMMVVPEESRVDDSSSPSAAVNP